MGALMALSPPPPPPITDGTKKPMTNRVKPKTEDSSSNKKLDTPLILTSFSKKLV